MPKRTTVRPPQDVKARPKPKAVAEKQSRAALTEDGLRVVVAKNRTAGKPKRVLPLVSTETGGLMPGVDLTKFSTYQEMEDLEYVERMKNFK